MTHKPKPQSSLAEKELDKAQKQFEAFDDNIKEMTLDRMNMAPKEDLEPQTKLSQKELEKSKEIYLKPIRRVAAQDKFNEKFRARYEFDKEYVRFIAENKEIIGESIDIWTRPYGGMAAEEWMVPTNKPIWGPRYLAEQIKRKCYHRLIMDTTRSIGGDHQGNQYYGSMAVDTTIQRLDAMPVSNNKSIFMGANNFS